MKVNKQRGICPQDGSQYDPVALALLHLVQHDQHNWMSHIHLEHEFCMDCDWKRVDLTQSGKVRLLAPGNA